jgi:tyrosinase
MKAAAVLTSLLLGASTSWAMPTVEVRNDPAADAEAVADLTASIRASVLSNLDEREAKLLKRGEKATCTARNIVFRRE